MFGIPSMIRAITGSITSVLTSTTKATDALAVLSDTWSESIIGSQEENLQKMLDSKLDEIAEEHQKITESLNKKGPRVVLKARLAFKQYYIRNNKPVPQHLDLEIQQLEVQVAGSFLSTGLSFC